MKITEAVKLIETMVKNYLEENKIQKFIPVLVGPPGIGKTAMLHTLAEKNNWGLVPIHIAQIPMEMLSGIPLPNYEENAVYWTEPEFIHKANKLAKEKNAVILFFDDIHTARDDKQELFFELAVNRSLHGFKLEDNVFIIAAGNFKITHGGKRFLTPILSRFAWWNIELDPKAWLNWAIENNVHPSIIIYFTVNETKLHTDLLQEPEHLSVEFKGYPTPRTWVMLSEQLYMLEQAYGINITNISDKIFTDFDTALRTIITGTLGNKVGEEFYKFLKIAIDINIDEIIAKDFEPYLNITNPAKKYYLLFAITNTIAGDITYDFTKNTLIPNSKKAKKLFKWLDILDKLYKATNSKLILALTRRALINARVNTKRGKGIPLLTILMTTLNNDKNIEEFAKQFDTKGIDIHRIVNFVKSDLSISNLI